MQMQLKSLSSDPSRGIALIIETTSGSYTLTESRRDSLSTESRIRDELRSMIPVDVNDELQVHKNRDSSLSIAVGKPVITWSEDIPVPVDVDEEV